MTLDRNTLKMVEHQRCRRAKYLAQVPPDRVGAEKCMELIDLILDRRPRPIAVASDGEILLSDQSTWVLNQSGQPESVYTEEQLRNHPDVIAARRSLGLEGEK